MAALTATEVTKRLPVGDRTMKTLRFTIANANAGDEWIVTGLSTIESVVGSAVIGQADVAETPAFRKNAQGTDVAEGTNHGDLAVEGNAATFEVTVIGRP